MANHNFPKQPRQYAVDIVALDSRDERRKAFELQALVKEHVISHFSRLPRAHGAAS